MSKSAAAKVLEALAAAGGGQLDMGALTKLQKGGMARVEEANSVMRSLHKPHAYIKKTCKRKTCGAIFETNYCAMAYCTDDCLAADMRDIGIVWDPFKMSRYESSMFASDSNVTWRYEPPEYISTLTIDALEPVFRAWLADVERLRAKASQVESQQTERMLQGLGEDFQTPDLLEYVEPASLSPEGPSPLPSLPSSQDSIPLEDDLLSVLPMPIVDFDF